MVLQNPTVDTAVFEVARGGILREGLGYDRNDVAVVTNVTGDHLGLGGIDTLGQLANVKGVRGRGGAALGHGGAQRRRRARVPDGPPLRRARDPVLDGEGEGRGRLRPRRRPHRARQRGLLPRGHAAGRADGPAPRAAQDAGAVHAPHARHVRRAGADERRQRAGGGRGVRGPRAPISTTSARACGRSRRRSSRRRAGSTWSRWRGIRVVIDYCHNVDGMRQLADFVNRMMDEPAAVAAGRGARAGRAIGVIGIPGDRRDQDQQRLRRARRHRLRRDRHPRGPQPARAPAGRDGGQRGRGDPVPPGRGLARAPRSWRRSSTRRRPCTRRSVARRRATSWWCARTTPVGVYREAMALGGRGPGRDGVRGPGRARGAAGLSRRHAAPTSRARHPGSSAAGLA